MSDLILWLPEIKFRLQNQFGSKAANLGFISNELRKTPSGFCISSNVYIYSMNRAGVLETIESMASNTKGKDLREMEKASQEIVRIIMDMPVPEKIEVVLKEYYLKLIGNRTGIKVAVRSSATAEDLPSASFAGQLESFLNIETFSEVLEAVKKCWASLWTPRAIHYRFERGIGQEHIGMAVIIQEMVPAETAGVMFTANPINNSRDEYYIEAVRGLGESLVLGESNADRYVVAKNGLEIKSIETIEGEAYLDEIFIKALSDEGRKLELMYEDPQDVEWAYYRGEIFILQTRPITTLGEEEHKLPPVEEMTKIQRDIWTNVNERFPEPVLPLDGIIAKIYYQSLFSAYSKLGFTVPEVDWRNVEKGLFPDMFVPPGIKPNLLRAIKFFELSNFDISKEWMENEEILNRYLKLLKKQTLPNFPLEVIFEYLQDVLRDFERALGLRYALYIQFSAYNNTLAKLLIRFFGEEGRKIHEDLVVGHPQVTTELNQSLMDLVNLARADESVKNIVINSKDIEIQDKLKEDARGNELVSKFESFIENCGDRELSQGLGGLAVPTWSEKPEVVWGMIKAILISGKDPLEQQKNTMHRRQEAERLLLKYTTSWKLRPIRGQIMKLVVAARKYNSFREDSHYYLTKAMSITRRMFLEIGKRLVGRNLLKEPSDITYLTYFELRDLLYALYNLEKVSKMELTEKIELRKQQQKIRLKKWRNRHLEVEGTEGMLKGIGASSGKVSGFCRVITDPRDLSKLRPGDILVAEYTNPAWTPVFSFINGLIVEYGSTVSHAAIIAREYGIPAVMGVPGVTKLLTDGEQIIIDGNKGLIRREVKTTS